MKNLFPFVLATAATFAATPLAAQGVNPQCVAPANNNSQYTEDACQKASDVFQYIAPQLGVAVAGGNAILGQGGTLGGLGHVYIGVRANVLQGNLPRVDAVTPSVNGPRSDQYPTRNQLLVLPVADAAIGIFRGIPLGVTNVGGVDLLANATYLPSFTSGTVDVSEPGGSFKLGVGARVGILQESLVLPGISATFMRRELPTLQIVARSGQDTLRVDNAGIRADSWRVVASKSLFVFGIAIGAGQDKYQSNARVSAYVAPRALGGPGLFTPEARGGPVAFTQNVTRTTYFLDATLNLPIVKIIGEVGQASGGTVRTYNTFSGSAPNAARVFGSLGLRIGL